MPVLQVRHVWWEMERETDAGTMRARPGANGWLMDGCFVSSERAHSRENSSRPGQEGLACNVRIIQTGAVRGALVPSMPVNRGDDLCCRCMYS